MPHQRSWDHGWPCGGWTGLISTSSLVVETCAPDERPPPNLAELNRDDDFHSVPESADRLSESANLVVNMGLILQRRLVQPLRDRGADGVKTYNENILHRAPVGNRQWRSLIVQADRILTQLKVPDWYYPGVFESTITRWSANGEKEVIPPREQR